MAGVNGYRGFSTTDVSASFGALQKLTDNYASAIAKNPALVENADFVASFNLSKQAVTALNAASRMATPNYAIKADDVAAIGAALKNPLLSTGQAAQLKAALAGAQKTAAIAENALRLNDSLTLSQKAMTKVQKAFNGTSAVEQTAAVGELTRQLGKTLKSGNQLQGEIGNAVFSNNTVYAAANKGVSVAVNTVVPVTDIAGAMADLANAQTAAARDFMAMQKVFLDPKATLSAKIIASAKATGSASSFVSRQGDFLASIGSADKSFLEQSDVYRRLTDKTRNAKYVMMASTAKNNLMQGALHAAEIGGLSAAFVLSAVSLPSLLVSTKKNFNKLMDTVEDPDASLVQMADALGETARAGAGTVYAVQGLEASFVGITHALKRSEKVAHLLAKAEGSVIVNNPLVAFSKSTFGKILNFLLPIADVGIALADTMKAYHTFHDPDADFGAKARSTLDVGLDLIKVLTYLIPQARAMRYAYIGASFAQMGLATWDFARMMKPTATKVSAAFVDAFSHPGATIKAIGNAAQEGIMRVKKMIDSSVEWVENLFENPKETIDNIEKSAIAFEHRLLDGSRKVLAKVQKTLKGEPASTPVPAPA
ncbi:MAG TPA: hypothetical protein DD435_10105 [Cyanobacteria bacterium UBA8530]|nr:hypothetical protein [Cyanobacteria bacterium UBA8530]